MNALVSSELTRQQQDILKVLKFAQRAWRHAHRLSRSKKEERADEQIHGQWCFGTF